ncbi:3-dehydroquinate synthase [Helicovermis profundi]|uniref:3-dehydroquinate synthase n=1 Tax=Helicovermis profundi TaxID=3065157 RepID=A0AAU9E5U1_9FIRM|nr:3-dehydroquinate synthase [Clostridia bacterium S502]
MVNNEKNKIKIININTNDDYNIILGNNIFEKSILYIKKVTKSKKIVIITDDIVESLYYSKIENHLTKNNYLVKKIVMKNGETSKNLTTCEFLYSKLAKYNIRRDDTIIALGGGVVGDIVGFVASSFLRGINFIQIPTTLLSQVDSSVGGKVAVNIEEGKNLVGAFYNPKLVIVDTEFLKTLSIEQIKDGLGEIIKYSYIYDDSLGKLLMNLENVKEISKKYSEIIEKSLLIKKYFVENDMYDKGERMILNFGHTIGHVIEKQYGYGVITHGQAIAEGMFIISEFAYKKGLVKIDYSGEIRSVLDKFGFSKTVRLDRKFFNNVVRNDKKFFNESVNIIVINNARKAIIFKMSLDEFLEKFDNYLIDKYSEN